MYDKKIRAFYEFRQNKEQEIQISREQGINFPPHLHEDLELIWVQQGCVRVMVGTQWKELTPGGFAAVFPNTIHAYQSEGEGNLFTMAICRPSLLGEDLPRLTHHVPVCPFLEEEQLHPDIPYAMEGIFRQMQQAPDREIFRALLRLILARLFTSLELVQMDEPKSIDLTSRLVEYLSKNFLSTLSLEKVAKELGVSRCHISHIFSSRLKTSFSEYLHFLRLGYACELLQNTDKSISDISLDAGFSSQRTFNRAFQKRYGVSPRTYRSETINPNAFHKGS